MNKKPFSPRRGSLNLSQENTEEMKILIQPWESDRAVQWIL